MKNLFKVGILLAFVFSSLVVSTGAYAAPSHVSRQTIPSNFTIGSQFYGTGASRYATASTNIASPKPQNKAGVKCELQDNAGSRIDYKTKTGVFGGTGVSVTCSNLTKNTGRLVLFSTHDMWVNATSYVEYRQIESSR